LKRFGIIFSSLCEDELALELSQAAKDRQHQPAMRGLAQLLGV
jgi:hypothetical protein